MLPEKYCRAELFSLSELDVHRVAVLQRSWEIFDEKQSTDGRNFRGLSENSRIENG